MSTRKKIIEQNELPSTKTSFLILPMLGFPKSHYDNWLIDCYIKVEDKKIVIVLGNETNDDLSMLVYKLQALSEWESEDLYDDNNEIVITCKVPSQYLEDFNKFLSGDYSKFSEKYKELLFRKGFYTKLTADNSLDKYGFPVKSVYEMVYPPEGKLKILEKAIGVKLHKREIMSSPDLILEEYKSVSELIQIYGQPRIF
jgi:hypothetical protein